MKFSVVWYEPKRENPKSLRMLEKEFDHVIPAIEFFHYLCECTDVSGLKLKKMGANNE